MLSKKWVNELPDKIENGSGECFKETTTRPKSKKTQGHQLYTARKFHTRSRASETQF